MATSSTFVCGVCDSQHINKDAEHWCPECEEGLCPNCLIFHNSSKLSRGHGIISIENYKQLPQYIRNIRQICPDHDRKYQHYCSSHEVPCCPFCMTTNHSECKGLQVLEEVVKTSELSGQYEDMKQSLRDVKNNIERIKIDRAENLQSIEEERKQIQCDVKQVRQQINSHLDKLEKQAIANLESTEHKVKCQIETLLSKLSTSSEEAEKLWHIISSMSSYASDLQRFLGRKEIESNVAKSEEYINSLVEDGSLQQVTMNCSIDSNVSGMLSSIISLCTIFTESSKTNIRLKKEKEKQAQIMTVPPTAHTSIHDINVQLVKTLTLPKGSEQTYITGCTINPSGKMVFADYNNRRLIILNADGGVDGVFHLAVPYDVTSIDDRKVAVIQNEQIQILDLPSKTVGKTIKVMNCSASGMSYGNNEFLYCESGKGILMLKLSGGNPKNVIIKDSEIKYWNYIASFRNNIYHTNMVNDTVTCFKISGEKIWELRDKAVLRTPYSVVVDKYSNIYVASLGNTSIVVISPDGSQSRTLISSLKSWAIDLDKERNILMVAEYPGNNVKVYKIT